VKEIERVARRLSGDPRVDAVYLFGSQASGEADDRSDVDLAVLLREGISLAEELRFVPSRSTSCIATTSISSFSMTRRRCCATKW